MRSILSALLLLVALILPAFAVADTFARISHLEGDVLVRFSDSDEWQPASLNLPVGEGDSLWSEANGRFELQLPNGVVARFDHSSQLDLIRLNDAHHQLHLASGKMYLVTPKELGVALQIDVDDTTVLPFGRSRMRIDALPNGVEDVSIFNGAAYVESRGQRTTVRAGDQILVEEASSTILGLNAPDEWERWNSLRPRRNSLKGGSDQELPAELRPYAGEFAAHGNWVELPEFGMVWRPIEAADASWVPYQAGRWILMHNEYQWVGVETWGWIPYHYGRWVVLPGRGWCWVPPRRGEVRWTGGHVAWFQANNHIGWVPLAPGEHHRVAPGSRFSPELYRNYKVPRAVGYIPANVFGSGRTVVVAHLRGVVNPQPLSRPPVVNRPVPRQYQKTPILSSQSVPSGPQVSRVQPVPPAATVSPLPGSNPSYMAPTTSPQPVQRRPVMVSPDLLKSRFPQVVQPQARIPQHDKPVVPVTKPGDRSQATVHEVRPDSHGIKPGQTVVKQPAPQKDEKLHQSQNKGKEHQGGQRDKKIWVVREK
ncbi:MAG: hypothetical protein LWW87_09665 [Geobacteraceae bacterium]|nr:hypothetical protein [Geobacteraceae bacterium]